MPAIERLPPSPLSPFSYSGEVPPHAALYQARGVNTVYQYDERRKLIVRMVVLVVATLSMTSTIISFYWFSRMNKRFRHKLVMLLMFGAFVRALGYMVYASNTLAKEGSNGDSVLCKTSGWMIQWGVESNDFAALFTAVHSGLQVFRPQNTSLVSNGLYKHRHSVYLCVLGLPFLMASLAFSRPEIAYQPQGPFCTLPIRPIWYRLVLAWIPRYLIMIIIITLAVAIYVHVGVQFKNYARRQRESEAELSATLDKIPASSAATRPGGEARQDCVALQVPTDLGATRSFERGTRTSLNVTFSEDPLNADSSDPNRSRRPSIACRSADNIDPLSQAPECPVPQRPRRISTFRFGAFGRTSYRSSVDSDVSGSGPVSSARSSSWGLRSSGKIPLTVLEKRRQGIHRQLRLLFVYPSIYIAMWVIPSVLVFMQYNDRFAQRPPFALSLLNFVSLSAMGFVDSVVFSFREKPWRRIVGSDGTFWGSFTFWRHFSGGSDGDPSRRGSVSADEAGTSRSHRNSTGSFDGAPGQQSGAGQLARGPFRFWSQTGKTDQEKLAAEMAYDRLSSERAETARQRLGVGDGSAGSGGGPERAREESMKKLKLPQAQQAQWWDKWHEDADSVADDATDDVAEEGLDDVGDAAEQEKEQDGDGEDEQ